MYQAEKCLHTFLLIALHSGDALSAQGPVVEATGAQKSPPEPTGKQSPGPGPWIFKAPKKAGEHIEENGLWQQAQVRDTSVLPQEGKNPTKYGQCLLYSTFQELRITPVVFREAASRVQAPKSKETSKETVLIEPA